MDANDALTPSREARILEMARSHLEAAGVRRLHERSVVFTWTEAFGGAIQPPRGGVVYRDDPYAGWSAVVPLEGMTPRKWRLLRELAGFTGDAPAPTSEMARKRTRSMQPEGVVRALAIYFLSEAGGGSRTVADAYDVLSKAVPLAYSEAWDEPGHYATIRALHERYGALTQSEAA